MAFPHADLTIASLGELLRALNARTRVAGLPVGGLDNALGAQLASLWLTGKPPRLRFVEGEARHDAALCAADRLLESGEADALLWIDALGRRVPPAGIPTIALSRPGATFVTPPAVLIPVGTPGLDHPGHVLRGDAIVALRLDKLRDSGLPAVAQVIEAIMARAA
jgi:formylmethanofuran dehydrogenase subunit B